MTDAPPSPGVVAARVKKAAEAIGALGLYIDGGFLGGNDAIAAAKAALSTVQPTTGGGGDREAIARIIDPDFELGGVTARAAFAKADAIIALRPAPSGETDETTENRTMNTCTLIEDKDVPGQFRVESFTDDGSCEVAIFAGPNALDRAIAFAASANPGYYDGWADPQDWGVALMTDNSGKTDEATFEAELARFQGDYSFGHKDDLRRFFLAGRRSRPTLDEMAAEVGRLRAALNDIAEMCPATQEISTATLMGSIAIQAL